MSDRQQNRHSLGGAPDTSPGDGRKTDYRVGYKRPPVHTRFKPGQSGNPKGRPAGRPNHKTTIDRVMNEKVAVREGEKTRHMTKFEAMLQAQTVKGMKGDARSTGVVIKRDDSDRTARRSGGRQWDAKRSARGTRQQGSASRCTV